jgi:hypothetical protein
MNRSENQLEQNEKSSYDNNWAEYEYIIVCESSRTGCDVKDSKERCGLWNTWRSLDLASLFKENVDENKNYLLNFK